jgi:hypothetical protein
VPLSSRSGCGRDGRSTGSKRGSRPFARLAAELGSVALKEGFAAWVSADVAGDLGELMCAELERLRTTAAHI